MLGFCRASAKSHGLQEEPKAKKIAVADSAPKVDAFLSYWIVFATMYVLGDSMDFIPFVGSLRFLLLAWMVLPSETVAPWLHSAFVCPALDVLESNFRRHTTAALQRSAQWTARCLSCVLALGMPMLVNCMPTADLLPLADACMGAGRCVQAENTKRLVKSLPTLEPRAAAPAPGAHDMVNNPAANENQPGVPNAAGLSAIAEEEGAVEVGGHVGHGASDLNDDLMAGQGLSNWIRRAGHNNKNGVLKTRQSIF